MKLRLSYIVFHCIFSARELLDKLGPLHLRGILLCSTYAQ